MPNVRFLSVRKKSTFDALETKDSAALYWIEQTQELYRGSTLYGTGRVVTDEFAGLMSPEDKAKLDALVASSGSLAGLSAVDGTIKLADTTDGGKSIGVAIAPDTGNTLTAVDGGLFVPTVVVPEYSIEKQVTASEGQAATYRLKKTVGDQVSYVGDPIDIAKNMVLQSATLETVTEADVPYVGAVVGDPYIKMVFNNADASNLYIPVKGLVDKFEAGIGISIENNVISVKLADTTHGLVAVNGALSLKLATKDSDGAMSKEDKKILDAIPEMYVARKYEISGTPIGTLVNYGDKEIRIMCPVNAEFSKQNVGTGGDKNTYYMTFRAYAPNDNITGYIERLGNQVDSEILTNLSVDEYGRKYQSTWLGLATYNETTNTWSYYGKNSTTEKFIGWDYQINWYNAENMLIASDSIRINLSNEDCHNYIRPYYGPENDVSTEITELQNTIAEMQEMYSWGEM